MAKAAYDNLQAELKFQADEKAFEDKHHLPHQIYRGNKLHKMFESHRNYRDFPAYLLQERKWTQSRKCHAEKKFEDLILSNVVTRQTTIADLRNDLGGAMWYF